MKRVLIIPALVVVGAFIAMRTVDAQKPSASPRVIEITVADVLKFSIETIQAKPGESLKVVIKSTGSAPKIAMGHNFVLLKPGVSPLEFVNAGISHRDTDFIDPAMKDKVIASTTIIGPGETADTTFKAPMKPGSYDYLCTFPGHFAGGMKGALIVK